MEKSKKIVLAELDQRVVHLLGALLKAALPSRERAYQLNRLLQQEPGASSPETIRRQILSYYAIHFQRRTAGQFARTFGVRPYPWLHNQFLLNFSNAMITDTVLFKTASDLRFMVMTSVNPPREIVDPSFLHLVLYKLVHPRAHQPKAGLGLTDLLRVWRRTAQTKWGEQYDFFFNEILEEPFENLAAPPSQPPVSMQTFEEAPGNDLELTQTDLDWMKRILTALHQDQQLPHYPLRAGPKNRPARNLEKIVRKLPSLRRPEGVNLLKQTALDLCVAYLKAYGQFQVQDLNFRKVMGEN